jgi:hypothetical protein
LSLNAARNRSGSSIGARLDFESPSPWWTHYPFPVLDSARDALNRLDAMDAQRHRFNNLFTLEMRWRTANRKRALAEDAKLLDETRPLMGCRYRLTEGARHSMAREWRRRGPTLAIN